MTKKTLVPRSFDIIGNKEKAVAIIEIPHELNRKAIAEALMKKHKNVRSVLLKSSARKGVYRTRKLRLIAGEKNTEVVHTEHGLRFMLDPKKVYFSPREGTERQRIAELVKPNEVVMVFFAGIGPFAIAVSKKAKAKKIIGIEINPAAIKYFKRNAKLNKVDVEIVKGDVKEKSKEFYGACDHVIMPLPESSIDYLKEAFNCIKPKGIIHFYCFSKENEINKAKGKIKSIAKDLNREIKFLEITRVLPYGPRVWKYRIDFRIE